jgi:hypothetical protein
MGVFAPGGAGEWTFGDREKENMTFWAITKVFSLHL